MMPNCLKERKTLLNFFDKPSLQETGKVNEL